VRLVLDVLHHRCRHAGEPLIDALAQAVATWPADERPKVHFSSPRTELRRLVRQGRAQLLMPLPNQHSDFIHPFEFVEFLTAARAAGVRPFDVMVEAKAKELAVLRLREQLAHFAPSLAPLVG
jgi:UV DNA damage endonuclease